MFLMDRLSKFLSQIIIQVHHGILSLKSYTFSPVPNFSKATASLVYKIIISRTDISPLESVDAWNITDKIYIPALPR